MYKEQTKRDHSKPSIIDSSLRTTFSFAQLDECRCLKHM